MSEIVGEPRAEECAALRVLVVRHIEGASPEELLRFLDVVGTAFERKAEKFAPFVHQATAGIRQALCRAYGLPSPVRSAGVPAPVEPAGREPAR
jgi:hypothetical protein